MEVLGEHLPQLSACSCLRFPYDRLGSLPFFLGEGIRSCDVAELAGLAQDFFGDFDRALLLGLPEDLSFVDPGVCEYLSDVFSILEASREGACCFDHSEF